MTVWRPWRLLWTIRAEKDLRRLDPQVRQRVRQGMRAYAETGRGDVVQLRGSGDRRLRVGDWRVRFMLDPERRALIVLRVLPRGRAYRG